MVIYFAFQIHCDVLIYLYGASSPLCLVLSDKQDHSCSKNHDAVDSGGINKIKWKTVSDISFSSDPSSRSALIPTQWPVCATASLTVSPEGGMHLSPTWQIKDITEHALVLKTLFPLQQVRSVSLIQTFCPRCILTVLNFGWRSSAATVIDASNWSENDATVGCIHIWYDLPVLWWWSCGMCSLLLFTYLLILGVVPGDENRDGHVVDQDPTPPHRCLRADHPVYQTREWDLRTDLLSAHPLICCAYLIQIVELLPDSFLQEKTSSQLVLRSNLGHTLFLQQHLIALVDWLVTGGEPKGDRCYADGCVSGRHGSPLSGGRTVGTV